jgi:hypothetical protein
MLQLMFYFLHLLLQNIEFQWLEMTFHLKLLIEIFKREVFFLVQKILLKLEMSFFGLVEKWILKLNRLKIKDHQIILNQE